MFNVNWAPTRARPRSMVLRTWPTGLAPAEGLLDLLALALAHCVARMARGAPVDGRAFGLCGHVRRHAHVAQLGDEVGAVVALVGTEGETALRAWRVPLTHRDGGRAL